MTDSQLQKFDYLSSPYVRPNQKWECGRLREGKPCIKGPAENGKCHTRTECSPIKREDRWYCARSPLTGGICEDGPNSDGSCCHIISPCSPVRSWRAKRGLLSKWMLSLCLGVAVLMLSHSEMAAFISPGKLVTKHADIGDCQSCHSPFEQGITHWVKTAIALDSGVDDSKLCLNCHVFRDNAQHPHNLSLASLDKLTQEAAPATEAGLYPQLRLGAWLFPEREHQRESLTCASCHREHKNDDSLLTNLSNQQCLICHQAKFDNFSNGHPEFSDFPYARRTKLNFDHVTHVNKHFKEEKYENIADGSCTQCHEPDSNGRKMLVKSFETSCSSCHISQIMGETRSGPRGLAVFAVPGIDVETLQAQGMLIGDWPVQSDADLSQFTELLLSSDGKYVAAKAQLVDIDLLDLSDASIKQLQSVYELAWSVKRLFYDLLTFGTAELKKRLESTSGQQIENVDAISLLAILPEDAVRMAQQDWFPRLFTELPLYQSNDLSGLKAMLSSPLDKAITKPLPQTVKSSTNSNDDGDLFDDDSGEDDDLFGDDDDDLFGDDDDDPFAEDEESGEKKTVQLSSEQWAAFGGWYRDEYALRYAPTGHADTFLKSWIDYLSSRNGASEKRLFNSLIKTKSVGACNKCHTVDLINDNEHKVNWQSIGTDADSISFTNYSHTAHFNLTDDRGCVQCHVIDNDADYAAGFKHQNPHNYSSNFKPIERQFCADCHQSQLAGDSCLQCHNYHITEILSDLMANGK